SAVVSRSLLLLPPQRSKQIATTRVSCMSPHMSPTPCQRQLGLLLSTLLKKRIWLNRHGSEETISWQDCVNFSNAMSRLATCEAKGCSSDLNLWRIASRKNLPMHWV